MNELVLQALVAVQTDLNKLLCDFNQPDAALRNFDPADVNQDENEGWLDVSGDIAITVWKPAFSNNMQYRAYAGEADLCPNANSPNMAVEAVLLNIVQRKVREMYDKKVPVFDITKDEDLRNLYKEMGRNLDEEIAKPEAEAEAEVSNGDV